MEDEQESPVITFERRKNPRYDDNYAYLWYKQEDLELRFSKHVEHHEEGIKKIMLDIVGSAQFRVIFKNMLDESADIMVNKIIAQIAKDISIPLMKFMWLVFAGMLVTHLSELKTLFH